MKKQFLFIFFLLILSFSLAQKKKSTKLGQVTEDELKLQIYESDTLAKALVLYEHANVFIDPENEYKFRTDYYYRIKLFNKSAFDLTTIKIPLYKEEEAIAIKAVTYNLENNSITKTSLKKSNVFTTQEDDYWKETKFTLPNLKPGSVIEYTYSVLSPYPQIDDWYFQSEIPKLKSEYNASIVANYKYNARLIGFKELDKNDVSVKKYCLSMPGMNDGSCVVYAFGMNDIPAFYEEDYMLSKENYLSRISLDLISFTSTRGGVTKYTETWDNADRTLIKRFLDNQTSKSNFFKKQIPESILSNKNDIDKAKGIYYFVQNKLFWNDKYWTRGKLNIKNTYKESSGSVDAINLILYNSLQAADIESYIVASSTRSNGLPTKLYPIIKDFNYILVKAIIDGKTFFLDATDKFLAFGEIPFRCLNGDGRILDFDKGSYWEPIQTISKSIKNIRLELDFVDNTLIGKLQVDKKGYEASAERKKINGTSKEKYLNIFENEYPLITIQNYSDKNLGNLEKNLSQSFDVEIEIDELSNMTLISPFIYEKITKNPFKLKERKYIVDFGFPRIISYSLKLNLPKNYSASNLPESQSFTLPNNGGSFVINSSQKDTSIIVSTRFSLAKQTYTPEEYLYLKEFYNKVINIYQSKIEIIKS